MVWGVEILDPVQAMKAERTHTRSGGEDLMTSIKGSLCLCVLSALAFCAALPQGATAATGTTTYTCKGVAKNTGHFQRAHCKPSDAGTGDYEHVAVSQDTTTETLVTNVGTSSDTTAAVVFKLQGVRFGVPWELEGTSLSGTGSRTNKNAAGGEHYIDGSNLLALTGVTMTAPAGKGCKLKAIEFKKWSETTLGQGMAIKYSPAAGPTLIKFEIEGCSLAPINGVYEMKGSFTATPDGATVNFTHAGITAQATLTSDGNKAGLDGSLTVSGRGVGELTYAPLSVTTVETP